MVVNIVKGSNVDIQWACKSFPISINDCIFLIELICSPFKIIDVVLRMVWITASSVYISCKENAIFIPVEAATPNDVLSTLLECTNNMINCLYEKDKTFPLILTMDFEDKKIHN